TDDRKETMVPVTHINTSTARMRVRSRQARSPLASDLSVVFTLRSPSPIFLKDGLHLALPDGAFQGRVIFVVLISIGQGERCYGLIEYIVVVPHVPAQHGPLPRPSVTERKGPSAPLGIEVHFCTSEVFYARANLGIPELTYEEIALRPSTPPQENIAGWLNNPVAVHYPLPTVGKHTLTCVRLQYRSPCLLDLEEEWIVTGGHKKEYPAGGPNTSDSDNLHSSVSDFEPIQQRLVGRWKRGAITGDCVMRDLVYLPRRIFFVVEDRGELVFDNRHFLFVLDQLGKEFLRAAFRLFLLDPA